LTRSSFIFFVAPALFAGPAFAQEADDCVAVDASRRSAFATAGGSSMDSTARARSWVDLGMGAGWFHAARTRDAVSFTLDFSGGFWLRPEIGIGARAGGWTMEGFSLADPREGESLSEIFGLLKVRPLGSTPLVITVGGGWAEYVAHDPARVLREGDGVGWRAEVEWGIWRSGDWSLGTALGASWGNIDPDAEAERDFGYAGGSLLVRGAWHW
jgi:hypothetical protein